MKKKIKIAAAVFVLLTAAGYGFYQYNRPPADVRKESADISIDAAALVQAYDLDEETANRNYVDKVLLVAGKVARVDYDAFGMATIQLDSGNPLSAVICSFYREETPALKNVVPGTMVRIKGVCNGKLTDVILNKCSMAK